jgi:hypothetical protein
MILYSQLNRKNELAVRRYRLHVKRRLFIRNRVFEIFIKFQGNIGGIGVG